MDKVEKIKLAENIRKAAKAREDSWNPESGSYTKTLTDCCYEACPSDKDEANIIFLLLEAAWSDTLDWVDYRLS